MSRNQRIKHSLTVLRTTPFRCRTVLSEQGCDGDTTERPKGQRPHRAPRCLGVNSPAVPCDPGPDLEHSHLRNRSSFQRGHVRCRAGLAVSLVKRDTNVRVARVGWSRRGNRRVISQTSREPCRSMAQHPRCASMERRPALEGPFSVQARERRPVMQGDRPLAADCRLSPGNSTNKERQLVRGREFDERSSVWNEGLPEVIDQQTTPARPQLIHNAGTSR